MSSCEALLKENAYLKATIKLLKKQNDLIQMENGAQDRLIKQYRNLKSSTAAFFCDRLHPLCKISHSRYSYINSRNSKKDVSTCDTSKNDMKVTAIERAEQDAANFRKVASVQVWSSTSKKIR